MLLSAIQLSITEVIILSVLCIISATALYFFWVSRRSLQRLLKQEERRIKLANAGNFSNETAGKELKKKATPYSGPLFSNNTVKSPNLKLSKLWDSLPSGDEVPQPKSSAQLRRAIEDFYDPSIGRPDYEDKANKEKIAALKIEVETLQQSLEEKAAEVQKVKQQFAATQKIAARMDDVYKEYDLLQQRIADLETQAGRANAYAIELEDAKETAIQLKKDLVRKQAKLQDMIAESSQLHQQLSETEDKLEEANLHRKQLMKKVQFLESINGEFQQVTDNNKKLQNELRRIGELESMLSMMADERDNLLHRKRP
jgi:predicted  nucleic acid-binding Zn-ribbon protein